MCVCDSREEKAVDSIASLRFMNLEDLGLNRNYLIALEEVTGDSGLWPLSGKGGSRGGA